MLGSSRPEIVNEVGHPNGGALLFHEACIGSDRQALKVEPLSVVRKASRRLLRKTENSTKHEPTNGRRVHPLQPDQV